MGIQTPLQSQLTDTSLGRCQKKLLISWMECRKMCQSWLQVCESPVNRLCCDQGNEWAGWKPVQGEAGNTNGIESSTSELTELLLSQAGRGKQAQCCASAGVVLPLAQEVAWVPLHSGALPGPVFHGRAGRNHHPARVALSLHRNGRYSESCLSGSLLLAQVLARQQSPQGGNECGALSHCFVWWEGSCVATDLYGQLSTQNCARRHNGFVCKLCPKVLILKCTKLIPWKQRVLWSNGVTFGQYPSASKYSDIVNSFQVLLRKWGRRKSKTSSCFLSLLCLCLHGYAHYYSRCALKTVFIFFW